MVVAALFSKASPQTLEKPCMTLPADPSIIRNMYVRAVRLGMLYVDESGDSSLVGTDS